MTPAGCSYRSSVLSPSATGVWFHSLRRTHATMLVAEGLDLKVIQYRMGHESIQTTLALYAAPLEANLRKSAGVSSRCLAS